MSGITFKRKFYDEMLEWKKNSNGKSALMIDGARRVGKSTIAEEFAKNEYDDYLLIDFVNASKDIKDNFENLGNMDVFFRNLFLFAGKGLKSSNSVIIFDEVQKFPRAREAIKYLVKDGRYHYIETGSLISIKKKSQQIYNQSEIAKQVNKGIKILKNTSLSDDQIIDLTDCLTNISRIIDTKERSK